MNKRDRIFYSACSLSGMGVVLAILGYELAILLFVAAYLLRPALHEFGLRDEIIQGIPCAKYRFMSVLFGGGDATYFHDNGHLRSCTLSDNATIEGKEF
ncbi:MAG: hypothetical protein ABIE07_02560 [Candidatus Zixiibacteriota bacterium]